MKWWKFIVGAFIFLGEIIFCYLVKYDCWSQDTTNLIFGSFQLYHLVWLIGFFLLPDDFSTAKLKPLFIYVSPLFLPASQPSGWPRLGSAQLRVGWLTRLDGKRRNCRKKNFIQMWLVEIEEEEEEGISHSWMIYFQALISRVKTYWNFILYSLPHFLLHPFVLSPPPHIPIYPHPALPWPTNQVSFSLRSDMKIITCSKVKENRRRVEPQLTSVR